MAWLKLAPPYLERDCRHAVIEGDAESDGWKGKEDERGLFHVRRRRARCVQSDLRSPAYAPTSAGLSVPRCRALYRPIRILRNVTHVATAASRRARATPPPLNACDTPMGVYEKNYRWRIHILAVGSLATLRWLRLCGRESRLCRHRQRLDTCPAPP